MNKAKEPWYWDNVNAAIALTLVVAMIALCCWLAPDRLGRVKIKDKGVNNEANNR